MHIVVISGTNRAGSQTLRLATAVARAHEAGGAQVTLLDLRGLPPELLGAEAYATKPAAFAPFAEAVLAADGLHLLTPEYNGGMPGALKLFIDHLKFPASFEKRPVAFVGLSAGRWGALRPVEQLQGVFGYRNAFVFPERVFIPGVEQALGPDGWPVDPLTARLLTQQISGFQAFCAAVAPLRPGRPA